MAMAKEGMCDEPSWTTMGVGGCASSEEWMKPSSILQELTIKGNII